MVPFYWKVWHMYNKNVKIWQNLIWKSSPLNSLIQFNPNNDGIVLGFSPLKTNNVITNYILTILHLNSAWMVIEWTVTNFHVFFCWSEVQDDCHCRTEIKQSRVHQTRQSGWNSYPISAQDSKAKLKTPCFFLQVTPFLQIICTLW